MYLPAVPPTLVLSALASLTLTRQTANITDWSFMLATHRRVRDITG